MAYSIPLILTYLWTHTHTHTLQEGMKRFSSYVTKVSGNTGRAFLSTKSEMILVKAKQRSLTRVFIMVKTEVRVRLPSQVGP